MNYVNNSIPCKFRIKIFQKDFIEYVLNQGIDYDKLTVRAAYKLMREFIELEVIEMDIQKTSDYMIVTGFYRKMG